MAREILFAVDLQTDGNLSRAVAPRLKLLLQRKTRVRKRHTANARTTNWGPTVPNMATFVV